MRLPGDKTPLQQLTPMTLAETASTMCETIATEAVLAQVTDPQEELAVLEAQMNGASQVVVDIYSRYLFEKEVFERRERPSFPPTSSTTSWNAPRRQPTARDSTSVSAKIHVDLEAALLLDRFSFYNYPLRVRPAVCHRLVRHLPAARRGVCGDYKNLLASTGEARRQTRRPFGINIRTKQVLG
jgi:oligoendopeptidase F